MSADVDLLFWIAVWTAAAAYLLLRHWHTDWGVGLLATYVVSLAAIHWLTPVLYLLPWHEGGALAETALGTREAALGMIGLAVGVEVVNHLRRRADTHGRDVRDVRKALGHRLVDVYLGAGLFLYFIASPLTEGIAGLTAIVSTGSTLVAVGIGLKCWNAWQTDRKMYMWLWLVSAALLPLITVAAQGFLGYGYAAMLIVLSFMASFNRPTWKEGAAALALGFLGLSVYVTYMRDRAEIREVVWSESSYEDRMERLSDTLSNFEWFNPTTPEHLERIEGRLNQNYFVGVAVDYIDGEARPFAGGETLWTAALAIIPRALWPGKPVFGGSGDLVTNYTGIEFAEGTSVGIGHVMELYVNFGTVGVVVGFVVIGILLVVADRGAAEQLHAGLGGTFLLWYLPGLCLLQVGGALGEVSGSAAAALVVAAVLNRWTILQRGGQRAPEVAGPARIDAREEAAR